MSYFAVIREAGPAWEDGKDAFGQPAVDEHASYMDALAGEGLVVFAGPLVRWPRTFTGWVTRL